jgi:hypothetical protein
MSRSNIATQFPTSGGYYVVFDTRNGPRTYKNPLMAAVAIMSGADRQRPLRATSADRCYSIRSPSPDPIEKLSTPA